MLEAGDTIVEVHEDHVVIETKDGTKQSYWNLNKELPFLKVSSQEGNSEGSSKEDSDLKGDRQ